jgi:lysophospholipase L1-like esterase
MKISISDSRWLAPVLLVLLVAGPLRGQVDYLALGDSITDGFGDGLPEFDPTAGYPPRLSDLLGAPVAKVGFGGETTTELLNDRVSDALAENPADVMLLMAGTNDVTQRRTGTPRSVSEETSIFNLDTIANLAADAGMSTVHATVIPRPPVAKKDPDNVDNQSFNQAIRDLAGTRGRQLVDNYEVWIVQEAYPNLYFSTDPNQDPVGHPNSSGYDLMAQTFFEVLTGIDRVAPVTGVMTPKKGDTGVEPEAQIVVDLWDFGVGIDLSSVQLLLDGQAVVATTTGNSLAVTIRYQPVTPLSGTVALAVQASDTAVPPNTTQRVVATFDIAGGGGGGGGGDFDGDVDGNGRVDGFDLLALAISFGASSNQLRYNENADFDGDGVVDGVDLAVLSSNFGRASSL